MEMMTDYAWNVWGILTRGTLKRIRKAAKIGEIAQMRKEQRMGEEFKCQRVESIIIFINKLNYVPVMKLRIFLSFKL